MQRTAEYFIEKLGLISHPEGGYYKETYRSSDLIEPKGFFGNRNVSTGIYFMLTEGNFSAFHRIKSDEMWHYYAGDPLDVYIIHQNGELEIVKVGLDLEKGERPQAVVPAGCWFASRVAVDGKFSLVGCTVAPGFDFKDFEMAERNELLKEFPSQDEVINQLTRS